jgi:hypothetical protein
MSNDPVVPNMFVCSVHVDTEPRWLDIQTRYVRANIPRARIIAAVDGSQLAHAKAILDYAAVLPGQHAEKLDTLASVVIEELSKSDDDILIFLDGDAFPIRPIDKFVLDVLSEWPLAAVCRRELPGEDFPHPSWCFTKVELWRQLPGTWSLSSFDNDRRNDMGAELRDLLEANGTPWHELHRSNLFDIHPVLFGIYASKVYHHGAGFRAPITSIDRRIWRSRAPRGTWDSPENYRFFADVVEGQNKVLSDAVITMMSFWPDFNRVFEVKQPDSALPEHITPSRRFWFDRIRGHSNDPDLD